MTNENVSTSDSVDIHVVRNNPIYPEVSSVKVVGCFDCVVQRVGGLREEFKAYNAVTLEGRHALLSGIGRDSVVTNAAWFDDTVANQKTGMFFSTQTSAPGAGTSSTLNSGSFTATGSVEAGANTIAEGTVTGVWMASGPNDIFDATAASASTLTSADLQISATSASLPAVIETILIVDSTGTTTSNTSVWAGAAVTVNLGTVGATLTASYALTIS